MKNIAPRIQGFYQRRTRTILNKIARINQNPIFVLGNQKSGTTAIAVLLGEATNLSVTIDIPGIYNPVRTQLYANEIPFSKFVSNNKLAFSKDIVKEPELTYHYDKLIGYFPDSKYIYIIREPTENIRSILNLLKLPGNLVDLEERHLKSIPSKVMPCEWLTAVDGRWMGLEGNNYIEQLASRWNFFCDIYLKNASNMTLIRYEDFLNDKTGEIYRLAKRVGLTPVNDISEKVDIQYQPAGNRKITGENFFGPENLSSIERICGKRMEIIGYKQQ